jgi:hypothetical protein
LRIKSGSLHMRENMIVLWAFNSVLAFLQTQKERFNRKK